MIALVLSPEKLATFEFLIPGEYELLNSKNIIEVINQLKNAQHYTHVIVDVDFFNNSDEEILSSLYLFTASNATPVIVFAQGKFKGDPFLSSLVQMGIFNFVLTLQRNLILEEFQKCLDGVSFEDVQKYLIEEDKNKSSFFNRFRKKTTKTTSISVTGIMPRIGTTTQSIRLCKALHHLGHTACFVEQNNSGHVQVIKDVFSQAEEHKNMVTYSDVTMFYNGEKPKENEYDFVIYDCGINNPTGTYDYNILVVGSTAWEITTLAELMHQDKNDTIYLFSFTDKKEQDDILGFMGEAWIRTFFSDYCPDMFSESTKDEKEMLTKMILERRTTI